MSFVKKDVREGIATLTISRGKVNALIGDVIRQLRQDFAALEADPSTRAIVLTGEGKFFSFGFDIPEFFPYSREDFLAYLIHFTDLYTSMFLHPKPLVAALNGHAIAGGCMLALACDRRVMVSGKARISLNEIGFGSSVFAGSTEMLRFYLGGRCATEVLYSGALYSAEEAKALGLIDEVATGETLLETARKEARDMGRKSGAAFDTIGRWVNAESARPGTLTSDIAASEASTAAKLRASTASPRLP